MRYRNDGSMPLNYGDHGPFVKPGGEFESNDYPEISLTQLASHLQSGFISVVVDEVEPVDGRVVDMVFIDELHEHQSRDVIDAIADATDRHVETRTDDQKE